ncbi:MAG: glycosyltransferase [Pseudomonadota bacterium]
MLAPGRRARGGVDRLDTAPLGRILTDMGAIDQPRLEAALTRQTSTGLRLGEVLTAQNAVDEPTLTEALAQQWSIGTITPATDPPDPELFNPDALEIYLEHKILPWRRLGNITTYAVVEPSRAAEGLAALAPDAPFAFFAMIGPRAFEAALAGHLPEAAAERAAHRTPTEFSVRGLDRARIWFGLGLAAIVLTVVFGGPLAVAMGLVVLFLINAATTVLRLCALFASRRSQPGPAPAEGIIDLAGKRAPPKITLMVPLYREAEMVRAVIDALDRLDYPRELTEVILLLEDSDRETRAAVASTDLPGWVRAMVVPDGLPRTKPRALNYALDHAEGEIIGILDAEDRPAPDQLTRVAALLRSAPSDVACVQCQLSYFNARENWITRSFFIEYSIWFEVLLRGYRALGLPIPLGGTSVYFRRSSLRALGGWDAHNVTEDADLGMRLARAGLRAEVDLSVTEEEANCRIFPWIRQRSRWLKGYLFTWLSHMRAPGQLWRDLGPLGFFGLNVLFLGGATAYLAIPLFWTALLGWVVTGEGIWSSSVPGWAIWPAGVSLAVGQAVMLGCAVLALRRRGALDLILWVPLLPLYWTIGAIAAWKAIIEFFIAPFYWDKTRHGVSRQGFGAPMNTIPVDTI